MINKSSSRVHHRDLDTRVYRSKIKLVKTQKYLGVMIDPNLYFKSHAIYLAKKVRQITMSLRSFAARNYGQECKKSLQTIYCGAIISIVAYGSKILIDRLHIEKNKRQYLAAQAPISRIIAKCYASVFKDAPTVLGATLPLDSEIQIRNCIGKIKRGRIAQFIDELINPNIFDSSTHCKLHLKLRAIDIWQARWESSMKGRITFEFIPNIANRLDGPLLNLTFHKSLVLTGHGNFGIHLHRVGKQDESLCTTCDQIDDPIHRIVECP